MGVTHTCVALVSGTTLCWGDNADGQLGDGTRVPRTVPTAVWRASNPNYVERGNGEARTH